MLFSVEGLVDFFEVGSYKYMQFIYGSGMDQCCLEYVGSVCFVILMVDVMCLLL